MSKRASCRGRRRRGAAPAILKIEAGAEPGLQQFLGLRLGVGADRGDARHRAGEISGFRRSSASRSRPEVGRIWIVISRATSSCQPREESLMRMAAPAVSEARKVMMATTVTRARPAIEAAGTSAISRLPRRPKPRVTSPLPSQCRTFPAATCTRRIAPVKKLIARLNRKYGGGRRQGRDAGRRRTGPSRRDHGSRSRRMFPICGAR